MSISQNFPSSRPSLNLNFARSQKLDPRITFTRTSSATRVNSDGLIEVVPANQPRFDFDPISGECLGLLIEESRVNLFTWSENLNDVGWSTFLSSVTPNTNISPSGDISADTITFTANQFADINFPVGIQTGVTYTASIWARSVSGISTFRIKYWNGSVGTYSSNITVTETWERYNYTFVGTASAGFPNIGFSNSSDGSSKSVVLWGAQLEQGSFSTSYIPTSGSTATRTADNASITGSNFSDFYNPNEFTLLVSAKRDFITSSLVSYPNLLRLNEGVSSNNTIALYTASNSNVITNFSITSSGVSYTDYVQRSFTIGKPFKVIQSLKRNSSIFGTDGVMTTTDTSVEMPVGIDRMFIGYDGGVGQRWGGTIQQLVYYPTALPSNQLITLTK